MKKESEWNRHLPVVAGALIPLGLLPLSDAQVPVSLVFFLALWVLAVCDFLTYRLPNLFTFTLFVTGLGYVLLTPEAVLSHHLIGAGVGLVFLPLLNWAYRKLRARDGIGLGDAKLLAAIGVWLGWPQLPIVLLVASIFGLLFGAVTMLAGKGEGIQTRVPFGPFLCLGAWVSWLFFVWP